MIIGTYGIDRLLFIFEYDPQIVDKLRILPERRFDRRRKIWHCSPIEENIRAIRKTFPDALWEQDAENMVFRLEDERKERERVARGEIDGELLEGTPFKLPPFEHQKRALILGRSKDAFAYLMEQGTGKSKVLLDDAAHNFRKGKIDSLLIICPMSVKTNWCDPEDGKDEINTHMAPDIEYVKASYFSVPNKLQREKLKNVWDALRDKNKLKIIVANIEAISTKRAQDFLDEFVTRTSCMIAVDESTRIKSRTAKRTKAAIKLRANAKVARILSGTPIIKSPLDAYSQFEFLDKNILGYATYRSFSNHFAIFGGYLNKQVFRYVNMDELSNKIAGASYRITKAQCLDLPPKMYVKRKIDLSYEQETHYENMRKNLITWLDSQHNVTATVALTQLVRLQQITSNYLPVIDPDTWEQTGIQRISPTSPKIEEAMGIIDECSDKVICWARFRAEILEMSEHLTNRGIKHVLFYGDVSEEDRVKHRNQFQDDQETKVFVGQIRTGGIGLTLTAAQHVIYLSNSFSTEDRLQSEDRAHRIGQYGTVTYYDLVCPKTVDERIIKVLRENRKLSDEIMKDGWKEWI